MAKTCRTCAEIVTEPRCTYRERPFCYRAESCPYYRQHPKSLLADELAEVLDAILDAMIGSWFSYTKLPGKIEDAEAEAQKLVNRAYAVLARHQKETDDAEA